ncbi:hypothetical protein V8F33_012879 [Rhypophila sp. PSN 637]
MSIPGMCHDSFDIVEHFRSMAKELRSQKKELRSEYEKLRLENEKLRSQNEEQCFQLEQFGKRLSKLKDTVAYERKRVKKERAHNVDLFIKKTLYQEAENRVLRGVLFEIWGMTDEPEDGSVDFRELPKKVRKRIERGSPRRRRMHDGTAMTCCPFSCSRPSHRNVVSGHEPEEAEDDDENDEDEDDEDDDDYSGCEPCCRCCMFPACKPNDDTPQHGHHPNEDVVDTGRNSSSGSGAEGEEELVSDSVAAEAGSDLFEEVASPLLSDSVEETNGDEHQSISGGGGLDSESHYDNDVDDSDPLFEGGTPVLQSDLVQESNDEEHQSMAGVGGLDPDHISSDNVVAYSDPSAKEYTPVSHVDLVEMAKGEENQSMTGEGTDDDRGTLIEMQDTSAHREIEPDDHYDAEDELELSVGEEECMLGDLEEMKQHLPSLGHEDRKMLAGPHIANPPLEEIISDCLSNMSPMYRDTTTDEEDRRTLKPPRRKPKHSQTPAVSCLTTDMRDQADQQPILWTQKRPVDIGGNTSPRSLIKS